MIDFSEIILTRLSVHRMESESDEVHLSPDQIELTSHPDTERIARLLSGSFDQELIFRTDTEKYDDRESVHKLIIGFYRKKIDFHELSKRLAILYSESTGNAKYREVEFLVCHFENIYEEKISSDAIGIFIIDGREEYLRIHRDNGIINISVDEGLSFKKMDKACLIFHPDEKEGRNVLLQKINLNYMRNPFIDDFLKVKPVPTSFYNTSNEINVLRTYLNRHEDEEDRLDKMEKMNRSLEYFRSHDQYQQNAFESSVFEDPDEIDAFKAFRRNYAEDRDLEISDEYEISQNALNQRARYIRSVIKLDKNFHIYVHGNRHNIERGYDDAKGMKYYKIYYRNES